MPTGLHNYALRLIFCTRRDATRRARKHIYQFISPTIRTLLFGMHGDVATAMSKSFVTARPECHSHLVEEDDRQQDAYFALHVTPAVAKKPRDASLPRMRCRRYKARFHRMAAFTEEIHDGIIIG